MNAALTVGDISNLSTSLNSKVSKSQIASCTAKQTLSYVSVSDTWSCANIGIDDAQITYSSKTARTFLAAPTGSAGTPTFRTLASTDLPSSVTDGFWSSGSGDVYRSAGHVGIGTSTPTAKLEIAGAGLVPLTGTIESTGFFGQIEGTGTLFLSEVATGQYIRINGVDHLITDITSNTELWLDASMPTVAAGTKAYRSVVAGGTLLKAGPFEVQDAAASINGFFGIGNAAPTAPLQVGTYMAVGKGVGQEAVGSDIYFGANGLIAAQGSLMINIDSDNDSTGASFTILKDKETSSGTELFKVYENGNVLVGAGAPTQALDVVRNNTNNFIRIVNESSSAARDVGMVIENYRGVNMGSDNYFYFRNAQGSKTTPAATKNGNTLGGFYFQGQGATAGTWKSGAGIIAQAATSGAVDFTDTNQATDIHFQTNNGSSYATRMTVDATGNIGIGTTAPTQKLHVVGNVYAASTYTCTMGNASGSVSCSSDARLKENIKPIPQALEKILSLRGVEFDWNDRSKAYGRHDIGVIAQEVEKVFPSVVHESKETGMKMVDYGSLVAPLIGAVKELAQRMEDLFNRNESFSREIASLKEHNRRLEEGNERLREENTEIKKWLCAQPSPPVFCGETAGESANLGH